MPTEFDDSAHYALFKGPGAIRTGNSFEVRWSEITLAALRAAGLLDNMVDGTVPPATDMLWLDKNYDPAILREYDATGSSWEPMTFDRLFNRTTVTPLSPPTGTPNALLVDQPEKFAQNKLYSLIPASENAAGNVTIQVAGVGTYDVRYADGGLLFESELRTGERTVLLFTGTRFEVMFPMATLNDYVLSAEAARDDAREAATEAEYFASLMGVAINDFNLGSDPSTPGYDWND